MGPQQLLADAFRSVNLDNATAVRLRAEAPASRFDNYLDKAAAPRDGASASDESVRAARPEDETETEPKTPTTDTEGDTEVVVVAAGASVATAQVQALQVLASPAPVAAGTETGDPNRPVGAVDPASELPRAGGDAPSSTQWPVARTDAGDTGEDRIASRRTDAPVVDAPKSTAGDSGERAQARDSVSSPQAAISTTRSNGAASKGPSDSGSDGSRSGEKRSAEVKRAEPVQAPVVGPKQVGVERVDPQVQTLHQQKVAAWLADRREGSSIHTDPGKNEDSDVGGRTLSAKLRTLSLEKGEAAHRLRPSLASGHGDGPAAAVARFLVEGAGKVDAAFAVDVATSVAERPSVPRQAALAASGVVVGDLLAARSDSADSIENAARLLASSGSHGRHQVTMRLDPPELGQLRLAISMQQQDMTLRVEAQTQSVARLIESRLGELKEALATQGIRVDRADIVVRTPASSEANAHTQREPGQGSSGQSSSDGGGAGFLGGDPAHTPGQEARQEAWTGAREDGGALTHPEATDHETALNRRRTPATESLVDLVA